MSNVSAKADDTTLSKGKIIAFTAMIFGMFMAILDIQIVAASLSEIQAGLGASPDEISSVQTSYLIAEVIMIPLSGFLGRVMSTRVFFTISAAGFTIASALCATATSINEMMIYRALQGFIGGGMIPSVFAAAFTIFPASKRNLVSPLIGLIVTLAPTIGPTAGGYLSNAFSWHWLFLVNIIPGIFVTLAAWTFINFDHGDKRLWQKFDWLGLIGMGVFLGSLEYVLEEGQKHDWLNDSVIRNFTIIMALGAALFFWRAFSAKDPIVDLSAFSNLNFTIGSFFSFVMGIGIFGLTYLFPLYLSQIRHYDSLMIGETVFVAGFVMFFAAPISGLLSSRVDQRITMAIGLIGFSWGTWIMMGITSDWDFWELFWPQVIRGVSLMFCMVPINDIALGTLPPDRLKNASGLFNLTRNLGGAVGLAMINTLLSQRSDFHYQRLSETVQWDNHAAATMLESLQQQFSSVSMDGQTASLQTLSDMLHKEASIMAFSDIFYLLTLLFIALVVLILLVKKPQKVSAENAH